MRDFIEEMYKQTLKLEGKEEPNGQIQTTKIELSNTDVNKVADKVIEKLNNPPESPVISQQNKTTGQVQATNDISQSQQSIQLESEFQAE